MPKHPHLKKVLYKIEGMKTVCYSRFNCMSSAELRHHFMILLKNHEIVCDLLAESDARNRRADMVLNDVKQLAKDALTTQSKRYIKEIQRLESLVKKKKNVAEKQSKCLTDREPKSTSRTSATSS